MTSSIYEYALAMNLNAATFPQSGTFTDFNDRMRLIMAQLALLQGDGGGRNVLDGVPYVYSAVADDTEITIEETINTATLPEGFLLAFRVAAPDAHPQATATGVPNPVWLRVNGVSSPLVPPGRGTLENFALREGGVYFATFVSGEWHLLSTPAVDEKSDRPTYAVEGTAGELSLLGEYINSTLIIEKDGVTNPTGVLNIIIPAKLLQRWPVGSWISIFQQNHITVRVTFDDPIAAAPVTLRGAGAGNVYPVGKIVNEFVHFKIMRVSTLEMVVQLFPRGVR